MSKKALIIGITGGFGGAVAHALQVHGWQIRALNRDPEKARGTRSDLKDIEWSQGDAMHQADVDRAAVGVDVIVHAANPPGYKNWRGLAIPMLRCSIEAAQKNGARLVFPGNVYNFGPDAFPTLCETSPQNPVSDKGAVRVEMEAMLEAASRQGTGVVIVRAGDFFGAHAPGAWFSAAMVKTGKPIRSVVYPGSHEVAHAWAYLPDLGQTVAKLLERESELAEFEVFHFAGHTYERGVDIAHDVLHAAGHAEKSDHKIGSMPWWLLRTLSPFVSMFRELLEMRYLWQEAVVLDNQKLVRFLGQEPHTPIDAALSATLAHLGCLDEPGPAHSIPASAPT